ncbi:hypothetical protein [Amycolatopsis rubida]|uniref:hypothetical protein n=1 Tax=Amycolatopsis rubida TaxID=112413 RepID=UPI000B874E0B|nr:hypothetical protein [Amycolatopsis rubida]
MNDYAESLPSFVAGENPGNTVVIDSRAHRVVGGPALGTSVENSQWLIVGHNPGPATCPGS